MAFIYSLADTWADGATTFKGISLNVTDSASAAGSLLMDLQVGGVSRFSVTKGGKVTSSFSTSFNDAMFGPSGTSAGMRWAENVLSIHSGSSGFGLGANSNGGTVGGALSFGTSVWNNLDVFLTRDAANTLAQRNGVNAQAFNLYNTYTDASNYERGALRYDGNVLGLHSQALGTGTVRNIQIGGTASGINTHLLVGVASRLARFNHSGTTYFEVNTNSGEIRLALDRTFAQLSATPAVGMIARVTDATTPVVGMTVTGGGASAALCWYNGTNWTVIGV